MQIKKCLDFWGKVEFFWAGGVGILDMLIGRYYRVCQAQWMVFPRNHGVQLRCPVPDQVALNMKRTLRRHIWWWWRHRWSTCPLRFGPNSFYNFVRRPRLGYRPHHIPVPFWVLYLPKFISKIHLNVIMGTEIPVVWKYFGQTGSSNISWMWDSGWLMIKKQRGRWCSSMSLRTSERMMDWSLLPWHSSRPSMMTRNGGEGVAWLSESTQGVKTWHGWSSVLSQGWTQHYP